MAAFVGVRKLTRCRLRLLVRSITQLRLRSTGEGGSLLRLQHGANMTATHMIVSARSAPVVQAIDGATLLAAHGTVASDGDHTAVVIAATGGAAVLLQFLTFR